ncbi:MAG: nucleotidyltransferase [Deltaproteobacteria bacterium]|nr:nucleotidyltransferase [Deltaproteobacteria bacterium]
MKIPRDFADLLEAFAAQGVQYLVVGGYAVGAHDVPRFTKDIDLLIDATPENRDRCTLALQEFGAPDAVVAAMRDAGPDDVVWLGQPPLRIDLLQSIPGIDFAQAWPRRLTLDLEGLSIEVIGLQDLIAAKQAAARPQDRRDARALRRKLAAGR